MTKVTGVGRRRRRMQVIDDFRIKWRYWDLKEKADDRKEVKTTIHYMKTRKKYVFLQVPGAANKQHNNNNNNNNNNDNNNTLQRFFM